MNISHVDFWVHFYVFVMISLRTELNHGRLSYLAGVHDVDAGVPGLVLRVGVGAHLHGVGHVVVQGEVEVFQPVLLFHCLNVRVSERSLAF